MEYKLPEEDAMHVLFSALFPEHRLLSEIKYMLDNSSSNKKKSQPKIWETWEAVDEKVED